MSRYFEIRPYKNYGYINLPKDAIITEISYDSSINRIKIHYKSKSGEIYESDGDFGFEYSSFAKDEDINIINSMDKEHRETVYAQVVDCQDKKIVVIITKWIKK